LKRENGQDEADDGNDAAYIRDDLQGDLMGDVQPDGVHVHQHGEVRQVIAFAYRVSLVGLLYLASLLRPCAMGSKLFACIRYNRTRFTLLAFFDTRDFKNRCAVTHGLPGHLEIGLDRGGSYSSIAISTN